jgi:transposase
MCRSLRPSALIPPGLIVDQIHADPQQVTITVHSAHGSATCPSCGTLSSRVHSHYLRRVADLPLAGRPVQFLIRARRFRCDAVRCGRQIFTERFAPEDVIVRHTRHTAPLGAHPPPDAARPPVLWDRQPPPLAALDLLPPS